MKTPAEMESSGRPDPFTILGVTPTSGTEEIRAAYLRKVKEKPPDRCPEEFERIRDAYGALSDARRRAEALFLAVDPFVPLESLLDGRAPGRRHVDLTAWLAVLENRK